MPARSPEYMQARQAEIVDAALDCMTRLGAISVSLSDICDQAGISRGAFYVHFSSKDEAVSAVIARLRDTSIQEGAFSNPVELREALYARVRKNELPDRGKLALVEVELLLVARKSDVLRQALADALKDRFVFLERGFAQLAADGHLQPGVVPEQAAELVQAFLTGEGFASVAMSRPIGIKLAAIDLMLGGILKPGSFAAAPRANRRVAKAQPRPLTAT